MATSPHDTRIGERDYFKSIVERTNQDLINVSQTPDHLEGADIEARLADYTAILQTVQIARPAVRGLPVVSANNKDINAVLCAQGPSDAAKAAAAAAAEGVAAALSGMAVADVGPLVASLPDHPQAIAAQ